jgi:hypothetical protein
MFLNMSFQELAVNIRDILDPDVEDQTTQRTRRQDEKETKERGGAIPDLRSTINLSKNNYYGGRNNYWHKCCNKICKQWRNNITRGS